ncbi:MAG: alpha/beta hydrolase [Calditrichaeota bacterium]|nr:alpha/beta hydrolase [Calditrichota bacterium]
MENLSELCAAGSSFSEKWLPAAPNVLLRVITFLPVQKQNNPDIVFVSGWISKPIAWRDVLREMTRDFRVFYIETREKISSRIRGRVSFSVDRIGEDLVHLVSRLGVKPDRYILMGSSLGATAILDAVIHLHPQPKALALVAPNAEFRVPRWGLWLIRPFPPRLYLIFKPFVKWYLRNFRLDVTTDYAQYEKYSHALDAADPWKLKKAVLALAKYTVWDKLGAVTCPVLIVGASKDKLHEPENLKKMTALLPNAHYVDLETNRGTHSKKAVDALRKFIHGIQK